MENIDNLLQYFKEVIEGQSAIEFAEDMLESEKQASILTQLNTSTGKITEKQVPYEEYMKQSWGTEGDTLEKCIERSKISKLNDYAEIVNYYAGFLENGKVFVLNKKEKYVCFLYAVDKEENESYLYVHYNPLNVDIMSEIVDSDYLFKDIGLDMFDISTDENRMIDECNKLIR